MKPTKRRDKIKTYVMAAALLFCTVVGGYGILTAPKSDKADLEQELEQNQKALEQMEQTEQIDNLLETSSISPEENFGKKKKASVSVIGDSVFLGAAPAFKSIQKNAVIDAKISRQVYHGIEVAKEMKKKKKLGDIVIISLGTNGKFNPSTGQELIDFLGKKRTIYWINAYAKNVRWIKQVNKTIQSLADENENVYVVDWAKKAKKHPGWFYQDGTHLNTTGQTGFAKFVKKECGL